MTEAQERLFHTYFRAAVSGGCDTAQAKSIANERVLASIMRGDARVVAGRDRVRDNAGRDGPR